MGIAQFDENGIYSLGSVNGEEDLKPRPGVSLNPPPDEGTCQCCGRHISQLKPYDKEGVYKGAYLIKTFRRCGSFNEEAENAMREAEIEHPEENPRIWLMNKYGKEKGFALYMTAEAYSCVDASWECRDCVILSDDAYFEKRFAINQ